MQITANEHAQKKKITRMELRMLNQWTCAPRIFRYASHLETHAISLSSKKTSYEYVISAFFLVVCANEVCVCARRFI